MMTIRAKEHWSAVAPLAVLAALLGGCSDSDPVGYPSCAYQVCSIYERACVEHVASVVGCKMERAEGERLSPPVRYLAAAEVLDEWLAAAGELTPEQEQDNTDYIRGEAVVGLMPPGYDPENEPADIIDTVLAYYSNEAKEIIIITDHASEDAEDAYLVLIHEMVHAYQDAQRDLASLREAHGTTYDRSLGLRALIEGEAVLYQNLAGIALAGYKSDEIDWRRYFDDWQSYALELARESDVPRLDAYGLFPYPYGGELVFDAWRSGADRIELLYDLPPDSVRQVMGGFSSWPYQLANEDEHLDPAAIPILPAADYELLGGGHDSVWLLNAMMQRTAGSDLWQPLLDDVSADYLSVFRRGDEVVAVWRIRTTRAPELTAELLLPQPASWVDSAAGEPSAHVVSSVDSDLLLVAVSQGDAGPVLADIQDWQSPEQAYPDEQSNAASRLRPTRRYCSRPLGRK